MKVKIFKSLLLSGIIILMSGLFCNLFSQPSSGAIKLTYNYPDNKSVKYISSTTMAQIMDIEGQIMQTDVKSAFGCSVVSIGRQDDKIRLQITVDTLGQTSNGPMGYSGGSVGSVKGKSINIAISPNGKIADMTEAGTLTYYISGSGESNLSQTISDFFPILPVNPVKQGDTWKLTDSTMTSSPSTTMKITDNSENKFEGLETVNGIECAKITSTHSGIWTMSIKSPEADLMIKGPYTSISESLFAIKEGYFVKNTVSTRLNGQLELTSPMVMTMPITIDMKSVTEMK